MITVAVAGGAWCAVSPLAAVLLARLLSGRRQPVRRQP